MDLNAFLTFLTNAQQHKQTCIASLQPFGLLFQHVITQFEWTFNWFVSQTTAQFLNCLESTHNYGNTLPEFRPQILYLLNELAHNRLVLEEFNNQIDLLNNREGPQIVEMIDQATETNSGGRDALNVFPVEDEKEETVDQTSEEEEPEHLRKLFIKRLNHKTDDASLKAHFAQFGTVLKFARFFYPNNNQFWGFGIITYSRASMVEAALQAGAHQIKGQVIEATRFLLMQHGDSTNRDARGGGRDMPVWRGGSGGYNRGENERYDNGGHYGRYGRYDRNYHQSQGWNQQAPGQHQQQVGRSSDYGNSRYGRSTGGGPIRRSNNRLHSLVCPYRNRNHRQ